MIVRVSRWLYAKTYAYDYFRYYNWAYFPIGNTVTPPVTPFKKDNK